ncbi:guanine nucleotide exchange factor MSS4 homolog [Diprion similis]|uniref:guanine nucleotide exchange factor MSS4 homolog n=1 Tax=Diprion similis TaxID=362088 RepID=UPI001EF7F8BC|nr:guanine nucleotide exchange factor MSS4 homolog [Diprion similis]
MSSSVEIESLKDENGKNKYTVLCTFCSSKMLNPGSSTYVNIEVAVKLHRMQRKGEGEAEEEEEISDYWMVDDMFTFENIGFSNTVENLKYLICADCEIGPVGWHNLTDQKSYIALSRVKHD